MRTATATTRLVCEGCVLILRVIYSHNFYTSSEEKRQTPSKEGEKKFWCGTSEAVLCERLQTEKESQPPPIYASGRSF